MVNGAFNKILDPFTCRVRENMWPKYVNTEPINYMQFWVVLK